MTKNDFEVITKALLQYCKQYDIIDVPQDVLKPKDEKLLKLKEKLEKAYKFNTTNVISMSLKERNLLKIEAMKTSSVVI